MHLIKNYIKPHIKLNKETKITVVGSGYVGMSLAALLAQYNDVMLLDIDPDRVKKVNSGISTVADKDIDNLLNKNSLRLQASLDNKKAYKDSSFIIIATPTDYDENIQKFDISSVEAVVCDALAHAKEDALIIIKSTIPVGYTKYLQKKHRTERIVFSPEFLREGQALKDNQYPSRIIIGSKLKIARDFADLLLQVSKKKNVTTLFINSTEAEAIKLFANTYLALRVSFFNELDSYAFKNELDTKDIIKGVCLDERIGMIYNNPSFGYGGYCLPKDTKQLLQNFEDVPQNIISAVVNSNETRKDFIANEIIKLKPKHVGFYRLIMKEGSDNYRSSAISGIIERIQNKNIKTFIYEPTLKEKVFSGSSVISNINEFKKNSDVIVANRLNKELRDVEFKCFSRDIFQIN